MCIISMACLYMSAAGLTVIQARPLTVHGDMGPVVECLKSHGLEQREIAKVRVHEVGAQGHYSCWSLTMGYHAGDL